MVAFSPSPDEWDLDRLQRLVIENDLERGRIEYKRELGNGHKTLEAIAALANSFGASCSSASTRRRTDPTG
jgi:hypothetical protein